MKKDNAVPSNLIPLREVKIEEIYCCPQCGGLFNKEIRTWESYWEGEKAFCPFCSQVKGKDKAPEENLEKEEKEDKGWF